MNDLIFMIPFAIMFTVYVGLAVFLAVQIIIGMR